jgi:hypothetical protein
VSERSRSDQVQQLQLLAFFASIPPGLMVPSALASNGLSAAQYSTPEAAGSTRRRSRLSHVAHLELSRDIERDQNNSSTLTLSPLVVRRGGKSSKLEDGGQASFSRKSVASQTPREGAQAGEDDNDDTDGLDGLERLRGWRNDAMTQHLYETAAFWGGKVWQVSGELGGLSPGCLGKLFLNGCGNVGDPNDAFWLAQIYFLTHQYAQAERLLASPRPAPAAADSKGKGKPALQRLTDTSLACRYLAARCLVKQDKWEEALDMLGEENPWRGGQLSGRNVGSDDGGIKVCFPPSCLECVTGLLSLLESVRSIHVPPSRSNTSSSKCERPRETMLHGGTQSRRQVL